jgi:hypothetical protein
MLKVSVLILSLIAVILYADGCSRRLLNIDTTSPAKRYRIQLTETYTKAISEKDPWPYKVFMTAERNGQLFLSNEILDHYDSGDVGLGQVATDSEWLSENILRLGSRTIKKDQQYDWIEVLNNSDKTLSYVLISGIGTIPGEKFLLFDLKPSETIQLKVFAQTDKGSDYSRISFTGRVENQYNKLINSQARFKIAGKYKSPSHYSIIVNGNNVEIKSLEYESVGK